MTEAMIMLWDEMDDGPGDCDLASCADGCPLFQGFTDKSVILQATRRESAFREVDLSSWFLNRRNLSRC
jgi:hypothetical protein